MLRGLLASRVSSLKKTERFHVEDRGGERGHTMEGTVRGLGFRDMDDEEKLLPQNKYE